MSRPLILLVISLAVVILSSLTANWTVLTMVRRVNRARTKGAPLRFFGSSWRNVVAAYRKLHPKTVLGAVLIASSCVAFLAVLAVLYLVIWAVPQSLRMQ